MCLNSLGFTELQPSSSFLTVVSQDVRYMPTAPTGLPGTSFPKGKPIITVRHALGRIRRFV